MSALDSAAVMPPPQGPHNWGRWGADDERGVLNVLTPDRVRSAAAAVTQGVVYGLGIPVQNHDTPQLAYRGVPLRLTLQDGTDEGHYGPEFGCHPGTGTHEDYIVMATHATTHLDALVHVYNEYSHYNGVNFGAMKATPGAVKLGIEKVGGVAARAVIFDMVSYFGDHEEWVNPRAISAADLQGALEKQGSTFGQGDIAMIRTGYLQYWYAHRPDPRDYAQPGINLDAAAWLASMDAPVVGSDNSAVEVVPFDNGDFMAVHKFMLVNHGIMLLEYLDLSAPSRDKNYEGFLAIGPLKITGGTGSPVNPVFVA